MAYRHRLFLFSQSEGCGECKAEMYRILLIAGDSDLNIHSEVLAVQRSGRTQRAHTLTDVYEITKDQDFDIVHVAAHGDENGIQLGKDFLGVDILARIAKKARAKLVYFNSCNSARLGQYLIDNGIASVIMTSTAIDDTQDAWTIAGYFYTELARNGGDFKRAYQIAKPDNGTLIWLSNGRYVDLEIQPLLSELQDIKTQMQSIATQQNCMDGERESIDKRISEISKRLTWLFMFIGVLSAIVTFLVLIHLNGG
jgi:hypothetical protein